MYEESPRVIRKSKPCAACRAAMMTWTTEERQEDGTWEVTRIVRNCGHKLESDPQK